MMRFIMPIILIVISVLVFFIFTNQIYIDVGVLRTQVASYNTALDNSKTLEAKRDELTQKENSFDPTDLAKLQKLLPDNIDNIRLILEIEQIALPYNMILKDVKYDTTSSADTAANKTGVVQGGGAAPKALSQDFGVWNLAFSTVGTYSDFINFTNDLENNLRIVDISSVQFSSDTGTGASSLSPTSTSTQNISTQSYKYDFKIKTYWLKN